MGEIAHAFFVVIGLVVVCGLCAGAMTFAVVAVCCWMEWAPINIIVNIKNGEAEQ